MKDKMLKKEDTKEEANESIHTYNINLEISQQHSQDKREENKYKNIKSNIYVHAYSGKYYMYMKQMDNFTLKLQKNCQKAIRNNETRSVKHAKTLKHTHIHNTLSTNV